MKTKIIRRLVKDNQVCEVDESDDARQLARACGVNERDNHGKNNFSLKFPQVEGYVIAEIHVVWGLPERCRKERACVCVKGKYIDLEKFISSVHSVGVEYLVEMGYAIPAPKKEIDGLANAKPLLVIKEPYNPIIKEGWSGTNDLVEEEVVQKPERVETEGQKIERQAKNKRKADRRKRKADRRKARQRRAA